MCAGCHLIHAKQVIIAGVKNGGVSVVSRNTLEVTEFAIKGGSLSHLTPSIQEVGVHAKPVICNCVCDQRRGAGTSEDKRPLRS